MTQDIKNKYFNWLLEFVIPYGDQDKEQYESLMSCLFDLEFRSENPYDSNRSTDGINLRTRFNDGRYPIELNLPEYCTVLEMLVALSIRCEDQIMHDPFIGDRTYIWFWTMIKNMGLLEMRDGNFDIIYTRNMVIRMIDRKYNSDGSNGGLFVVPNCNYDMRETEIWYQLMGYLSEKVKD